MGSRYGIQSLAKEILQQVEAHFTLEQEIYDAYKNEQAEIRNKRVRRIVYMSLASIIAGIILVTQVILPKVNYDKAMQYIEDENYISAFTLLRQIRKNYQDSAEQMSQIKMDYVRQMCQTAEVGDILLLGHDPTNVSNPNSPMEWQILKRVNNKILVISKSCLFEKKEYANLEGYNYKTWDISELRRWLNKDFLGAAFDEEEKAAIVVSTVAKSGIPERTEYELGKTRYYYPGELGNDTNDKVFLLSIEEAKVYLDAINTTEAYWLRSSGYCAFDYDYSDIYSSAAYVRDDGTIDEGGRSQYRYCGVRPAMWISVGS